MKNVDTMLEFRRTWRFLIGAGVLDYGFEGVLEVPDSVFCVPDGFFGVPDGLSYIMALLLTFDPFSVILAHCALGCFCNVDSCCLNSGHHILKKHKHLKNYKVSF